MAVRHTLRHQRAADQLSNRRTSNVAVAAGGNRLFGYPTGYLGGISTRWMMRPCQDAPSLTPFISMMEVK